MIGTTELELHRSRAQWRYGVGCVALASVVAAIGVVLCTIMIVQLAVGRQPAWMILVIPVLALAIGSKAIPLLRGGWRLVRRGPGTLCLEPDRLTITDASVFTEPVVIKREDIESIEYAPSGLTSMGIFGDAVKEGAVRVSLIAERPDLLIRFRAPRVLPARRHLDDLHANSPIRPPVPGIDSAGLWLRLDDTPAVLRWHRPKDTQSRWGDPHS